MGHFSTGLDTPSWIQCARGSLHRLPEGVRMPLTQVQLSTVLADRAEISRTEAKRALGALEEGCWRSLETRRSADRGSGAVDRSRQAGAEGADGPQSGDGRGDQGRAKPASVDVRARPLAKARGTAQRAESPPPTGCAEVLTSPGPRSGASQSRPSTGSLGRDASQGSTRPVNPAARSFIPIG